MTAMTRQDGAPAAAEGEIPLLGHERLEDHTHQEARSTGGSVFGDRDDDRALGRMIAKLKRTPAGARKSDEALQDTAIGLYNKICTNIRRGTASEEQVAQAAGLFGESVEHLVERLNPQPPSSGGGASDLLAALRGS